MPGTTEHNSEFESLVAVDAGPLAAMIALRTSLEGLGLPNVVESENIKTWDPFATGGSIFWTRLLVPSGHATEAREAIAELRRSAKQTAEATEDSDSQEEIVENLGMRIRWCSLWLITAPIGLYQAISYFDQAQRLPQRPRGHTLTICAVALCVIPIVALLMVLASVFLG